MEKYEKNSNSDSPTTGLGTPKLKSTAIATGEQIISGTQGSVYTTPVRGQGYDGYNGYGSLTRKGGSFFERPEIPLLSNGENYYNDKQLIMRGENTNDK